MVMAWCVDRKSTGRRLVRSAMIGPVGRRGISIFAFWIALLASLPGVQSTLAADPLDEYRLAVGFYNKGQWKLAVESFQTFLKNNAQHAKAEAAHFYYALSLIKLDEFKAARDELRSYLKDYPKGREIALAGYWVGHCSFHLDDYASAEKELAAFLQKSPDHALREWALPFLGDAELRLKKPELALQHFDQAISAFPEGALVDDARFGRARCYELLKRAPEAIKAYEELAANRAGTRAAEAQLNLGGLLFDSNRYADAAAAYHAVEENFPKSPQVPIAQLNQGFARYQLGQFRDAIPHFEKLATSEKYAPEAALWKGLSYKGAGDLAAATQWLETAYGKYREHPIAEKLLYQWAECEQRRAAFDKARELYLEVVTRWPSGPLAEESLHAACQAAINGNRIPEAVTLLERFDQTYQGPENRLRLRQDVLKARVLAAKNDLPGATKLLRAVIDTTTFDSTRQLARYWLTDVQQRGGRHAEVLETSGPLVALWKEGEGPAEFAGVFVLRGASNLALARAAAAGEKVDAPSSEKQSRCQAAVDDTAKYRKIAPGGPLAPQALAIQAVARALAGQKSDSLQSLSELRQLAPESVEFESAEYEVGTIAYAREDWASAEELFIDLASRPKGRLHARSLADLGWAQQKQRKFIEAAATFTRLLNDHPTSDLAPEAAFMRGSALQEAGQLAEAQGAFAEAFRRQEATDHVFLAGLQSARMLTRLMRLPEADAVYETLLKRFGTRPDADKVLDEWATAHYNAEDYALADSLFRRLADQFPESPLADNARLSLAESELVAGHLDEARRQFERLAADAKSDDTVRQRSLFQLMQVDLELKRWDDLRKTAGDLLTRYPEGAYRYDAEWKLATADFHNQAFKPAQERLLKLKSMREEAVVRDAAWLPQVWVMLAEIACRQKDYDTVTAIVAEYRALDEKGPLLYQLDEVLGRSLKALGKFPEAREAFERVVSNDEGRQTETAAKSQFEIAETYMFEKDFQTALKEYLKVDILYKFPDWQAPSLFQAGVCQEALKQYKDAARTFEELIQNYPDNEVVPKARERLEQLRKRLAAS